MPAFLIKNVGLFVNIGIKYRIQVNVHQVVKILVVAACNRIHRLVRIGHGI